MSAGIGWVGLAMSLSLIGVAAVMSLWQHLGLEQRILWSAARALIQLLLVGGALTVLFRPGHPLWWSIAWIAAMIVYAGDVARRRAPEVPHFAPVASAACAASALVSLAIIFGLHILPMQSRTLVPVAGMMIGNSMTAAVVVARRLVEELRDKRDHVEVRLALAYPYRSAAQPHVRVALRAALSPQIETTKATGLIFLPGAMTGLILAGVAPLQAVLVQAVVMFLILGSSAISAVFVALGLLRRVFTRDHRLIPLNLRDTPAPRRGSRQRGLGCSPVFFDRYRGWTGAYRHIGNSPRSRRWRGHSAVAPAGTRHSAPVKTTAEISRPDVRDNVQATANT